MIDRGYGERILGHSLWLPTGETGKLNEKSHVKLGLWVAKYRRESTCNVILDGLRSFYGSHQREIAKGRYTAPDALKCEFVAVVTVN